MFCTIYSAQGIVFCCDTYKSKGWCVKLIFIWICSCDFQLISEVVREKVAKVCFEKFGSTFQETLIVLVVSQIMQRLNNAHQILINMLADLTQVFPKKCLIIHIFVVSAIHVKIYIDERP